MNGAGLHSALPARYPRWHRSLQFALVLRRPAGQGCQQRRHRRGSACAVDDVRGARPLSALSPDVAGRQLHQRRLLHQQRLRRAAHGEHEVHGQDVAHVPDAVRAPDGVHVPCVVRCVLRHELHAPDEVRALYADGDCGFHQLRGCHLHASRLLPHCCGCHDCRHDEDADHGHGLLRAGDVDLHPCVLHELQVSRRELSRRQGLHRC